MTDRPFIAGKTYEKVDFTKKPLEKGVYEECSFTACRMPGADLGGIRFIDCDFSSCDLSNAALVKTSFQDVEFRECKMLGLQFQECNPLGMSLRFEQCQLDNASFYQLKLPRIRFEHCLLREVDFTAADLTGAGFDHCDLERTLFENTLLEKADFTTAINYSLDPENNYLRGARFSLPGVTGLLDKYDINLDP